MALAFLAVEVPDLPSPAEPVKLPASNRGQEPQAFVNARGVPPTKLSRPPTARVHATAVRPVAVQLPLEPPRAPA